MATKARSIRIQLNTKDQKMQSIQDLLKRVGGLLGCDGCGRMAYLHIEGLGDPPPEFARDGAISMHIEG
jgi:hypothetical protein